MQVTLFVRCRWGVNGRLWPTRRQRGWRGEAGDLKPDAARTPPRSAGAPMGSLEAPAGRVIKACAGDSAMPFRQRRGAGEALRRSPHPARSSSAYRNRDDVRAAWRRWCERCLDPAIGRRAAPSLPLRTAMWLLEGREEKI